MDNEVQIRVDIQELVAALRRYAQRNHVSMLEVIAEHLLDDLPVNIGYAIKDLLSETGPEVTVTET